MSWNDLKRTQGRFHDSSGSRFFNRTWISWSEWRRPCLWRQRPRKLLTWHISLERSFGLGRVVQCLERQSTYHWKALSSILSAFLKIFFYPKTLLLVGKAAQLRLFFHPFFFWVRWRWTTFWMPGFSWKGSDVAGIEPGAFWSDANSTAWFISVSWNQLPLETCSSISISQL